MQKPTIDMSMPQNNINEDRNSSKYSSDALWYVLNFIKTGPKSNAKRSVDIFNERNGTALEVFAPTIVKAVMREGKIIMHESPLTYHYVFVRGTEAQIKALCCENNNGFSFMLNRSSEARYATLTDSQMDIFRTVAAAQRNELPFYDIQDIDILAGDKVEIAEGPFKGLQGVFMPRKRSNSGDFAIAVTQTIGTVVLDVKARYVRILEFAPGTKRPYEIIDSFVPKFMEALLAVNKGASLDVKQVSTLSIYCRRMEYARLDNPKINAKRLVLLFGAARLTGQEALAAKALKELDKCLPSVSSDSEKALISLILGAVTGNREILQQGFDELSAVNPLKRTHRTLLDYYNIFLS